MSSSNYEEKALVFNIQRYSVHDGPGIRTIVFLKGCPLDCPWCSNPEGKGYSRDISHNVSLCRSCGRCLAACPSRAISMVEGSITVDRGACTFCGECINICRMDAIKILGTPMSADEILHIVHKDEPFYKRSGGGLTVSGGEPLMNPDFLLQLLKAAKEEYNLNTAIETTCCAPAKALQSVIDYIDFLICDIKLIDSERHQKVLGVPNEQILRNIMTIANDYHDKQLLLRMPVIPNINDDGENIHGIAQFLSGLKREVPLELLPFHEFGSSKYTQIGLQYPLAGSNTAIPDKEYMSKIETAFREEGVLIVHT